MSSNPGIHYSLYIDVFGFCNLRCPSCPVGNIGDVGAHFTKGVMSPALLNAILEKANREILIERVGLFNWTEPLLHRTCRRWSGSYTRMATASRSART
ncbi:MAG: hypothetical protein WDO24_00595 [Pseudomonadota bacterium]